MNGDGFDDVVIGALKMNSFFSGAVYVVYGSTTLHTPSPVGALVRTKQAVVFYGPSNSWFGYSVGGAGVSIWYTVVTYILIFICLFFR